MFTGIVEETGRVLAFEPRLSTPDVIDHLYQWESVVRVHPTRAVA